MQTKVHYENGCKTSQFLRADKSKFGVSLNKFLASNNKCSLCDKKVSNFLQQFETIEETNLKIK